MKKHLLAAIVALVLPFPLALVHAETPARPNIVFILTDDLGWTDLGCFGSTFYETPNIDRLASQGMKFTSAYAACTVCSPTRASVLTGQYPARLHITDWIPGHKRPFARLSVSDWTMRLAPEVSNIAQVLKKVGYATASIGKWHLGDESCWPEKVGFDLNVAGCHRAQPSTYFSPYKIETLTDGPEGEFLSDRLTNEALKFIEANKDHPFFLYLPHYAVHTPLQAKPSVIAKYKAKADPKATHHDAVYGALIESVDDCVGRLLAQLDELKLGANTVVVFASDNGGLIESTSNAPLRAGKGSAYEGGVRVPLIVKWPGVTDAGSTCAVPVISADFYPTFAAMTGASVPASHTVDGRNIEPLLRQSGPLNREAVYWHYPHYHLGGATPYSAVRDGDFRLVEYHEDGRVELFDLKNDVGERHDLAAERPEKTAVLREQLHAWRREVGAQMPTPNPNADAEKDARKAKR
jgi:arylsulfatase A-like enzyme